MLKVIDQYLSVDELTLISEFNKNLYLIRSCKLNNDPYQLSEAYHWYKLHKVKDDLTFWPLCELELFSSNLIGRDFAEAFLAMYDNLSNDVQDFLEAIETITGCIRDDVEYRLDLHRLELTQSFIETTFGKYTFGEFYKSTGTFEDKVSDIKDDLIVNTALLEFEIAKIIKLLQKHKS